jgi:hypothetical protein
MGSPSTVCSSLDEDGNRGPFLDVKVSQANLPLLVPFFGIKPTITAHARVSLEQGTSETNIRPLAVRDDSATPCVSVNLVYASGPNAGQTFKTIQLSKDATGDPNFPTAILWDNPAGTNVGSLPSGVNLSDLYVQPFLNNCAGTGTNYDSTSGTNWINVYPTGNAPANDQAPVITGTAAAGGVFLSGCANMAGGYNQYFTSTTACQVTISANVAFAPNVTPTNDPNTTQATVNAVDSSGGTYPLTYQGGTLWSGPGPTVTPGDGRHLFDIQASQTAGSISGTLCKANGTTKACTNIDLGNHQQSFGACNGCGEPDESGPIVALRIRAAGSNPQSSGANVFQAGTSPNLVFEVDVQGLHLDAPGQVATVLRFGVPTDKETGLINCGQGTGASADSNAITNGCPLYGDQQCPVTSKDADFCAPMQIYNSALHQSGICNPELRETANPAYTDCVQATSGQRRNKIPGAIASLIVKNGVCSPDHWPEYSGSGNPPTYSFPPNDPRAITLIITAPADLSQQNVVVPIRNFATFYVTGWDTTGNAPKCNLPQPASPPTPPTLPPPPGGYGNEAYPGTGKKNQQNGAIWGHWIIYTDPNAGGQGTFCNTTALGICTPVLSR